MARPPGDDHRGVSAVLRRITGSPVVSVDVLAGGFTDALVYKCRLADDRTVVSKSAPPDDDEVATALRIEALVDARRCGRA